MLAIGIFAPVLHGLMGPLDELELCVAPLVVVITVLVVRVLSERSNGRPERIRSRQRAAARVGKKSKVR